MRWILAMVMVVTTACGSMASDFRWGNQPATWNQKPAPSPEQKKKSETGLIVGTVVLTATLIAVGFAVWAGSETDDLGSSRPTPEPWVPCCGH